VIAIVLWMGWDLFGYRPYNSTMYSQIEGYPCFFFQSKQKRDYYILLRVVEQGDDGNEEDDDNDDDDDDAGEGVINATG
jgi:hypothetical protein